MTKWCGLLQLMVPLVVWLCEETERAVRARKGHVSLLYIPRQFSKLQMKSTASGCSVDDTGLPSV